MIFFLTHKKIIPSAFMGHILVKGLLLFAFLSLPFLLKAQCPSGDASVFGLNTWNVYCYTNNNWTGYAGYYVDNNFNIDNSLFWPTTGTPSDAPGYSGCTVPVDNHSISYKRQGFPAGVYRLDIIMHDDDCNLLINGNIVFSHQGYQHGHPSVWIGPLDNTSTIEFQWNDPQVFSIGKLDITAITPPADLNAGISERDKTYCKQSDAFTITPGVFIPPNKDAYVQSGATASSTAFHDGDPNELVSRFFGTEYDQQIYINFDLSEILNPVESAVIRMNGYNNIGINPNQPVYIYDVSDTTWNESTITWNNQPVSSSTALAQTEIIDNDNTYYYWDITSYIQSAISSGKRYVSFMMNNKVSYNVRLRFSSRETSNPPLLMINAPRGGCTHTSYQWQSQDNCTGGWNDIASSTSLTFALPAITQSKCYRLKITDACSNTAYSTSTTIVINDPPAPTIEDDTICGDQSVSLTATGSPFSYGWYDMSDNLVNVGATYNTPVITSSTSYNVTSLIGTCESNDSTLVTIHHASGASAGQVNINRREICTNSIDSVVISIPDKIGHLKGWVFTPDNPFAILATPELKDTCIIIKNVFASGNYQLLVDSLNCAQDTSDAVHVSVFTQSDAGRIEKNNLTENSVEMRLINYSDHVISWQTSTDRFKNFIDYPYSSDLFTQNFNDNVTLYFRAIVQAADCAYDTTEITQVSKLVIYSSFSPNGDGLNDTWIIDGINNFPENSVEIFNRWGELVYSNKHYDNISVVWNGKDQNTEKISEGTYFYRITLEGEQEQTGYVVIQ